MHSRGVSREWAQSGARVLSSCMATETKTGTPHCKRAKARTEDCLRSKREAAAGCQWKKNHHREGRRAEWYQEERFPEGKGFLREAMVQEV